MLHHLKNNIGDPRNTILLAGYQAENTLGRKIEEGRGGSSDLRRADAPPSRSPKAGCFERPRGSRGDAGLDEAHCRGLKKVFLVHGEPEQQAAFVAAIRERYGLDVVAPRGGKLLEL